MGIPFSEWALRQMLWLRHGCPFPALYGDDGEMQCHSCMVDFLRDSVDTILKRFQAVDARRMEQWAEGKRPSANDNVGQAMNDWLKRHGYDGLFSESGECACKVGALDPGDCLTASCQPGYLQNCPKECGEHTFHITKSRM